MAKKMYVRWENGMLVLRQTRFSNEVIEHPHDVCAYAHSVEEMRRMVDHLYPDDIDYSLIEKSGN
jgi:hypothetical protein